MPAWLVSLTPVSSVCCAAGLFGVYAVADPKSDHEDLAWSIMQEVTRMCYSVRRGAPLAVVATAGSLGLVDRSRAARACSCTCTRVGRAHSV